MSNWSIGRWGRSGRRYRLRFHVNTLEWIGRWDAAHPGKPYSYHYWRRVWYRKARNGVIPRSPQIKTMFADLGIDDPAAFIAGTHVRFMEIEQ